MSETNFLCTLGEWGKVADLSCVHILIFLSLFLTLRLSIKGRHIDLGAESGQACFSNETGEGFATSSLP